MRRFFVLLAVAALVPLLAAAQQGDDWAGYGRYAAANAALQQAPAVVLMGDSITDGWDDADPAFFADGTYACRGISGQVAGQMLCRFRADVLDLKPRVVVILAGTNDIACNAGWAPLDRIADQVASMAELARANGVVPVIASILPAGHYPWRPEIEEVAAKIRRVNEQLRGYAEAQGIVWLDYYAPLAAADGSMRTEYTSDGVHLTAEGYDVLESCLVPCVEGLLAGDE